MKKRLLASILTCALSVSLLAGCGDKEVQSSNNDAPAAEQTQTESTESAGESAPAVNEDLSGTLTFAIWDNNLNDFIEENDMVSKFQEQYPNIDIEVEKIKDDSEYWNAMKMRASANQLPDVMFNKPFTLSRFKDYLIDLSGTTACANNELAAGYALDGKVLGIPMTSGYEYVFYWKDMFEEAGVEVPTTWPEFEATAKTLQDYYGKDNPDFMAIACGLRMNGRIILIWSLCLHLSLQMDRTGIQWHLWMHLLQKEQILIRPIKRFMNCLRQGYLEKIL